MTMLATKPRAFTPNEGTCLDRFLSTIGALGVLTFEEEQDLFRRIRGGDEQARETVLLHNVKLVISVARRYLGMLPLDDLIGEGVPGLMHAIDKFDHTRGFRFSTYATWWIRQSISRAASTGAQNVKIPYHVLEKEARAMRRLRDENLSTGELATLIGISYTEAYQLASALDGTLSLDAPLEKDNTSTLLAFVPDLHEEETQERRLLIADVRRLLAEILTEREARIIDLRFGLTGTRCTLAEVASVFHLTHERVRQIERAALRKLKQAPGMQELAEGVR